MLVGNGGLRRCVEETMREVRVRVLFGGGDAVDLGDVAGGEFFNTAVVSSESGLFVVILLGEWNLGGQFLCFINFAQLREHIDLLYGNWQQLGLFLFVAEV
jgi:hypothetical protein